ncbi:heavy metal efflux pump, CzcA family [Nitrosococcus halophilus Nc 4]|uniref:Heavy metal efflux pump, CzcA family n=1 Tax=Nitrosococcus halophilus (strain Nc4) TaxID=472759 RepID=D5C2E1_NITHN|nr:CusA/CzcA family heavy metal efflux RND transporter [Nitrosococcus halophilus]ADE14800.1 heavy metal efflux pump, CzcA family [Nitrosococcus halophilus Nc 4]
MVNEHQGAGPPSPEGAGLSGLQRLIGYCARRPLLILVTITALAFGGYRALTQAPLDAIPDLSDVQVIVFTEWPGRSPDLVEDQITYPLTTTLLAAPGVNYVRGQSFFGLSFVYVIFDEGVDMYWARSRVLEYLNTATADLPEGVAPTLGPDATGVGWVYQYALRDTGSRHSLDKLRSLQDFNLRYALEAVEGVAEVAAVGGYQREYQISLDPNKLASLGIPLKRVVEAVRDSNNDVGGRILEVAGHEQFIRGRGYVQSTADLEKVVLKTTKDGVPITIAEVGTVALGPALQRGQAELDGAGITVGGIVVMRYGENALAVIERVKQRLAEIQPGLPEGVEIVPVYDRATLIKQAIDTLQKTLIEEMLIVSLVIVVFLRHVRSTLVAVVTLPVAVLLAFIPMSYQGLTANIMSLGGIAVAIGAMVDAAIVMIENTHKRLHRWQEEDAPPEERAKSRIQVIIEAMQEVGPSIFFSLLIITVSFLPVFALEGTEGRLFKPLAFTKTYSMAFAALLSVTLVPALAVWLIRGRIQADRSQLNQWLVAAYRPIVRLAVRWRWAVVGIAVVILVGTVPIFRSLGHEFMPPLNEGSILYMPTALPGMSITEATQTLQTMDRIIKAFPEVDHVFGKIGRSTSPTDPAPLSMVETVITLKPKDQWRKGLTWEGLIQEMDAQLRFPGMPNIFWMPIQTRTEMLATGIRSALGIKVFGPDLKTIEKTAVAIEKALQQDPRTRPYTRSAFAERTTGGYFLDFTINREAAARFGLNVGDVERVLMVAAGGIVVSQTVEGRERYNILVRYARDYRDNLTALERVLVPTSTGTQVPITQVADIAFRTGPPSIRSEDGQLVGFVFVDVKGDMGIADYVALAKQVVAEQVDIPAGYRLAWAGQFKYFERAKAKLAILVPATVFLIFFMLFLHRGSLTETLIILFSVPFSLVGALWLLWWLDYKLSVAVGVGLIAVAGLAVELGLLMMVYLDLTYREGKAQGQLKTRADLNAAIQEGAGRRIRPVLMTGITTFMGLAPILFSTGAGADVMKRLAAPMIGGVISALAMVLVVFPAVYAIWKGRRLDRFAGSESEHSKNAPREGAHHHQRASPSDFSKQDNEDGFN